MDPGRRRPAAINGEVSARAAGLPLITVGLALGVVAVVVVWEKKPLSELGIRPQTRRTIIIALAASIVMAVGGTVVSLLLIRLLALPAPPLITERITIYLVWFSLWLVFSSSIAEGVLYRGFVIERLGQLSGSIWIGAAITLV